MNRLLVLTLAFTLFGAGVCVAQPLGQAQGAPQSEPGLVQGGGEGQTVDEGTLLERRLAASGRTHGSYRAAAKASGHRHGRAVRGHVAHGRKGHGRASHSRRHGRASHAHGAHHAAHSHKAHSHAGRAQRGRSRASRPAAAHHRHRR